jgi:hypothetical protein
MSDYTITPEARSYRQTLLINPFHPSVIRVVEEEEVKYKVSFNQAYVYDHANGIVSSPIQISGMGSNILLESGKKYVFYVELNLNGNNVSSASFGNESSAEEAPELPENTDDIKYFEVCRMDFLSLTSFKLRENIHWSGSGGGGGAAFTHPFRLIRVDSTTWRIETDGSSIINDDDGSSIPITNLGINRTSNGYVYIQCEITSGPVPSGVATVVVSATAKDEIEVAGGVQTYANLLIGQVYINLAGNDIDISQAWNNAALLSLMFESGDLRWAFQAHPSHVNSLTAGT